MSAPVAAVVAPVDYAVDIIIAIALFVTPYIASGFAIQRDADGYVIYGLKRKPSGIPPGWVFAVVWPILYGLLTADFYLSWRVRDYTDALWITGMVFRIAHIFFNAIWTPIGFTQHRWGLASIVLLAAALCSAGSVTSGAIYCVRQANANVLYLPPIFMSVVLLWYIYAAYMNINVMLQQKDEEINTRHRALEVALRNPRYDGK